MLKALADRVVLQMTALQILVQNLLYDISQVAIPWDRMDEEYLQEPRRWNATGKTFLSLPATCIVCGLARRAINAIHPDLLRFIIVLGPTSSTIDICTFSLGWFYYGIRTRSIQADVDKFHTHWFLQGFVT